MPHLTDARTGRPQPLAAPGTRLLLVAYCPASLRAALTADLIRRTGERHRLVVTVAPHACDAPEFRDPMRFNIHPPTGALPPDTAPDVHVRGPLDAAPDAETATETETEKTDERQTPASRIDLAVGDDPAPALTAEDADPLALRLALLARPRSGPPPGSAAEAAESAAVLAELRHDVARCAESPSAPMPATRVAAVHDAFDDDLDIPRALGLLDELRRDPDVAAGARFEALVHLDRTLGLDLARDIGRLA